MNNYSEPLMAAQRALTRASELAAERRYAEAAKHAGEAIARASAACVALRELEREREDG